MILHRIPQFIHEQAVYAPPLDSITNRKHSVLRVLRGGRLKGSTKMYF